jgi:hypothetical protein
MELRKIVSEICKIRLIVVGYMLANEETNSDCIEYFCAEFEGHENQQHGQILAMSACSRHQSSGIISVNWINSF